MSLPQCLFVSLLAGILTAFQPALAQDAPPLIQLDTQPAGRSSTQAPQAEPERPSRTSPDAVPQILLPPPTPAAPEAAANQEAPMIPERDRGDGVMAAAAVQELLVPLTPTSRTLDGSIRRQAPGGSTRRSAMSDAPIRLLVGTTKGAFVLDGDADRAAWRVRGPFCDGWPITHAVGDPATGTVWAGGGGEWPGAGVWRSADGGETWSLSKLTTGEIDEWARNDPEFAASMGWTEDIAPFGDRFAQVWSLGRAGDLLYAGTKPASLLVSEDEGETWSEVKGLTDHPSAPEWGPGAAGLVLHTIVADPADPDRMWVAISAAGVFFTEDGGVTWERRNDLADRADGGSTESTSALSKRAPSA